MFADLPFDIIHHVARRLDLRSYDSLGKTCWALYQQLRDEGTAKKCLLVMTYASCMLGKADIGQTSIPYSTLAQSAWANPEASARGTLGRCNDYDHAIQTASPYSVSILAYADSFAYHSGVLSYSTRSSLRILDMNHGRDTEKVFSNAVFCRSIGGDSPGGKEIDAESLVSLQVQGYASDIVVIVCDFGSHGQYLFAVNVSDAFEPLLQSADFRGHPRVLLCTRLRSTSKLFVRHNSKFMVVGTHNAVGDHHHREWLLYRYDLQTSTSVTKEPLQLRNFFGSELGSTVCFTIYQDDFYALTNQTSFESEEVDWTSYYHFIKFRLDDPTPDSKIGVIWRRQHLEGPINDSWTDLGFQLDHRTGELLIVECRKEWLAGGSQSVRTYYTQPFHRAPHGKLDDGLRHPPNDRLGRTLDAKSNSRWEEARPRVDRYVHTEMQQGYDHNVKEYIRAKTKWHGYHFNAQTLVDLVTDEVEVEGDWRPRERIKLRVASRYEITPLIADEGCIAGTGLVIRPRLLDKESEAMQESEDAFSPSTVSLWPPDHAPQELHDILCPGGRGGDVKAIIGDEGIIYMAGPAREPGSRERALIFISFDPTFGFEGMTRLDGSRVAPRQKDTPSNSYRKRRNGNDAETLDESVNRDLGDIYMGLAHVERLKRTRNGVDKTAAPTPFLNGDTSVVTEAPLQRPPALDVKREVRGKQVGGVKGTTATQPTYAQAHASRPARQPEVLDKEAHETGQDGDQLNIAPQATLPHLKGKPPGSSSSSSQAPSLSAPSSNQRHALASDKPAHPQPRKQLQTWRQRAAYRTIRRGFWLR